MTGARFAVCLTLVARAGVAQQTPRQPAALFGTVRDSAAGLPLEQAEVAILGTRLEALTDARGRYLLRGIPAGSVVVRVRRFGFHPFVDTLSLFPGDSLSLDVRLSASAYGMSPVIVTAGKRSQLLDRVVASVAVVSDTEIARRAVATIDEALDRAPGVQFLGGQVNIRGSSGFEQGVGSRVLLLVDGAPANQGDRGGIDWDMLPVSEIARIEILKGPGSSLYGSAALGGVVNLITRDVATGVHGRLQTFGGAFANPPYAVWGFRDSRGAMEGADLTGSYGGDAVRVALTAGGRHSDGYREQDQSDSWEMFGRGDWTPSPATRLHVTGSWASHQYQDPLQWCERGRCSDSGQAYQPFRIDTAVAGAYTRSDKGFVAATLTHTVSPRTSWLARGSWLRTDFTDVRRPAGEFGTGHRAGVEVRAESRASAARVVTVGAEGTRSDVASDVFGDHSEDEFAAYVESEQPLGPVHTTVGARIDYWAVDGAGLSAVVSPRVGAVLPAGRFVWRASAGRGFRAPSLAERFVTTSLAGLSVVPNPGLVPETAWSFDVGNAAQLSTRLRSDVALFWTEADDLVEPSVNPLAAQIQFRNVQRARIAGMEIGAYASPFTTRLTTSLAYTFLSTQAYDSVPARPLAFRPRHLVTLAADYDFGQVGIGADFRFMSRYARVELYPPTDPQVAPKILDLRAEYRRGGTRIGVIAQNALNYLYNLVPQTLAPVRRISVTATLTY